MAPTPLPKEPRRTPRFKRFNVLGVPVVAVQIPQVVAQMRHWIDCREPGNFVALTGMHGIIEAQRDPHFKRALHSAALAVPDGTPLVWLGRLRGHAMKRRVYGPDLMLEFCRETAGSGYRHYFYGGAPGVAQDLARNLKERFGELEVAGTFTPPFRELTEAEKHEVRERINQAGADVLWVGLSTPKQEAWMFEHRASLNVPVMLGVGAAFDFHTGRVRQAPCWFREHGLEWSWRLLSEPRRLWRRYLFGGAQFVFQVALEVFHLRQFE